MRNSTRCNSTRQHPQKLGIPVAAVIGGIQAGIDLWKSAVQAFKTTSSTTIKQIMNGKGFKELQ